MGGSGTTSCSKQHHLTFEAQHDTTVVHISVVQSGSVECRECVQHLRDDVARQLPRRLRIDQTNACGDQLGVDRLGLAGVDHGRQGGVFGPRLRGGARPHRNTSHARKGGKAHRLPSVGGIKRIELEVRCAHAGTIRYGDPWGHPRR